VVRGVGFLNNKHPFIREYTRDNQTGVLDLILHIQQDEYHILITKEDQPDLMNIEEFYQAGQGNFWVALCEEQVVGTISLLDIGNQQAALRKMFVAKEYRGGEAQTAKRLLEKAKNWAKEKGISDIFLGTTPQFLAAHRFYEKNGFLEINAEELPKAFPILEVDKKFYHYKVNERRI
jgi:N-acetylglutamate synthase-like GNAT family acetyltransferase